MHRSSLTDLPIKRFLSRKRTGRKGEGEGREGRERREGGGKGRQGRDDGAHLIQALLRACRGAHFRATFFKLVQLTDPALALPQPQRPSPQTILRHGYASGRGGFGRGEGCEGEGCPLVGVRIEAEKRASSIADLHAYEAGQCSAPNPVTRPQDRDTERANYNLLVCWSKSSVRRSHTPHAMEARGVRNHGLRFRVRLP